MRNYLTEHKKNIISEVTSKISQIEPGHIITFNYKGKNVHTPKPLVLCLNSNWEGKLHGINIEYISEDVLNKLADMTKVSFAEKISKKLRLRIISKLAIKTTIASPYNFYHQKLKQFLNKELASTGICYRQYTRTGISNMRVIDYRWKGKASV